MTTVIYLCGIAQKAFKYKGFLTVDLLKLQFREWIIYQIYAGGGKEILRKKSKAIAFKCKNRDKSFVQFWAVN